MKAQYKTYSGNKSLDQIREQCTAAGVLLDTTFYDDGSDHIMLVSVGPSGERAEVLFNMVNGRFFGTTPEGVHFTSDEHRDGEPWFDALLDFFYAAPVGAA